MKNPDIEVVLALKNGDNDAIVFITKRYTLK